MLIAITHITLYMISQSWRVDHCAHGVFLFKVSSEKRQRC